jgi:hypothetical protein
MDVEAVGPPSLYSSHIPPQSSSGDLMANTSKPDITLARRDTTFPSKNAGFLDTAQMDVRVGAGFDSSFALAVALRATIRKTQIGKAVLSVVHRDIGQKAIDCRRL